ncbi:MAG: DotA/TraY family protein [Alphaproteobacteria bacterium]
MQNIKTKDVLIYASMPRVVPRVKNLFSSGFSCLAFWMAHIYFTVRLLPANHPYLSSSNIGRFGVRHVIAEAAYNLKFTRNNIDQIFVFLGVLTGVVMLLAQFLILIYVLLISPAMAFSWFDTPDPASDIAYNLLDRVFGVPGVFCSTTSIANCTNFSAGVPFNTVGPTTAASVLPLPFQSALHQLFRYYSLALLLIAVLIFLYFIVVIIFETATSGTPFGQRFQNVWVPVRLVVALGLLVPAPVAGVGATLNSGQYIVLYAAKYGSSFATVGWNGFNDAVVGHSEFGGTAARPMGKRYSLFAIPEVPSVAALVEAMSIVHACAYSYSRLYAETPNDSGGTYPPASASYVQPASDTDMKVVPFLVKHVSGSQPAGTIAGTPLVGNPAPRLQVTYGGATASPDYLGALGFYYGSDILIRFGEYKTGNATFNDHPGLVKPICGDIRIKVASLADLGGAGAGRGGADHMLEGYYNMVMRMWFNDVRMRQFARAHIVATMETKASVITEFCSGSESPGSGSLSGHTNPPAFGFPSSAANCEVSPRPSADWKQTMIALYEDELRDLIRLAWGNHVNNSTTEDAIAADRAYGWVGAGVFYSKMAETNGGWIDAVSQTPYMDLYPLAMEQVRAQNRKSNENVEFKRQFTMSTKSPSGQEAPEGFSSMSERNQVALGLSSVFSYWNEEVKDFDEAERIDYQNIFMDSLNLLFGTSGLMAMRTSNAHLHPMVQLVAVGKGLVNSAVFNIAASTGGAFLGGAFSALSSKIKKFGEAGSQILLSTAFMGLTAGFVLFYILPFLPFVYFYFAAASWIKAIFEAMVGVPLWALAHLRIDGDGLPGDSAQNGYFLILEIFIRPILTVVGLVAAIVIFSTQVQVLNLIWDLVTSNVAGDASSTNADVLDMTSATDRRFQRGIVDQFFFTIIYTMVCYMMALASFKLIDRIPDNILRWAGAGVSSFGDINQDQVDSLSRYAAMGGMTMGNQASGAIVKLGGGVGNVVGGHIGKSTEAGQGAANAAPGGASVPAKT